MVMMLMGMRLRRMERNSLEEEEGEGEEERKEDEGTEPVEHRPHTHSLFSSFGQNKSTSVIEENSMPILSFFLSTFP